MTQANKPNIIGYDCKDGIFCVICANTDPSKNDKPILDIEKDDRDFECSSCGKKLKEQNQIKNQPTKARHTPGPWESYCKDGCWEIKHALGTIAYFSAYGDGQGHPELIAKAEANARLISAAPDLLRAAKAAVQHLEACLNGRLRHPYKSASLPVLREAISKAEEVNDEAKG